MSGWVVIYARDGSPVGRAELESSLETLGHRGPDGCSRWYRGSVAMGCQHFATTPEEVGERQPLSWADDRFHIVFDGRLDNRDELLSALGRTGPGGKALSDAAILLLAYERWEQDCFRHAIGPFAAAIYDVYRNRIVCGRDPLGDRTLFYYIDDRLAVIASEEQAVLSHPAVCDDLDETSFALHFAVRDVHDGRTFFQHVRELSPAHMLLLEPDRVQNTRYWDADPERKLVYRSDDEYGEHFHSLLNEAVKCRLRSASRVAVMMSGGLDSTSVASLAAQQLSGQPNPSRLHTVSYVFDELSSCDERHYMESVVSKYGIDATRFVADDEWPLRDTDAWPWNPNTPEGNCYRSIKERVYAAAAAAGTRTLLTGVFGDHLYTGADYALRDLWAEGRWADAGREVLHEIRDSGILSTLRGPRIRNSLGLGRLRPRWTMANPELGWLTPAAMQHVDQAPPHRSEQWRNVLGAVAARSASAEIFYANRAGIDLRHPYRDRRLIEFMLAIPAHQHYRHGLHKHVLRTAMRGILPERVRTRRRATSLQALYARGLDRRADLVHSLRHKAGQVWRPHVRPEWLRTALPGQMPSAIEEVVIWRCIAAELWQRQRTWQEPGLAGDLRGDVQHQELVAAGGRAHPLD